MIFGFALMLLLIEVAVLWGGWIQSGSIKSPEWRIFTRSWIIAIFFTPSILFGGHAFLPVPAFWALFLYLYYEDTRKFSFYYGVLPILVAWAAVFLIWIVGFEIRVAWKKRK
jgi:hypothetical protein